MIVATHGVQALPLILLAAVLAASPVGYAQVSPALQRATVAITSPSADAPVTGTAWLSLPGQTALEQSVAAIYDPSSPMYHKFFTWETLAPSLPTAAQLHAVRAELVTHNLTVTQLDPHNLSITFQGRSGDFEAAFHTKIEQHTLTNGKQVTAFTSAPAMENGAAGLVQNVTGIGAPPEEPALAPPIDPRTGKQLGVETLQQAAAEAKTVGPYYCVFAPASTLLTTPGQPLPDAAYAGPIYGAPLSGGKLSGTDKCGYTPAQFYLQTGLDTIHAAGYTGTGQTIALLEEAGSSTLASDLAAFDETYNIPAANLQIVNLSTPPSSSNNETTLDVEWAHAVAPDAKILVVDGDLQSGLGYVMGSNPTKSILAYVVSTSYGSEEKKRPSAYIQGWNSELLTASAMGINADFSSGDYGDRIADEGELDVNVPADSPYATGVGGLSIAYVPGTTHLYKTSWGTDMTQIGTNGVPLAVPQPVPHTPAGVLKFGSGGGVSVLPLPGYQAALGGTGRHVPDVSDIADGYTGLKIVVTDPNNCKTNPCSEIEGGTSLASPVFSGKWALLNQANGSSLGQAAPLIAQFANTPAIEDIVPLPSSAVVGASLSTSGLQTFTASELASAETSQPFVSALWQEAGSGNDYVLSFGTDSSLAVTPGYDSATGWGQLDIAAIFASLTTSAGAK